MKMHIRVSRLIQAPPTQVYAIIADYQDGHQRIIPKQYFPTLTVTNGGKGSGTTLTFQMNAFGNQRDQNFMTRLFLENVYRQELEQLEMVARAN